MQLKLLTPDFFDRDACIVAKELLGKILRRHYQGVWLSARIIETEAYYRHEKGSHSSLGYTEKRKAMFMHAGTIYMYYARGKDSLNISAHGPGNAVLVKSAYPYSEDETSLQHSIAVMQSLHQKNNERALQKLCAGQTLLCQSLALRVPEWNQAQFNPDKFFIENVGIKPKRIIQTRRLGIPLGRDEHLLYRFIDFDFARYCTSNPLTKRQWQLAKDYLIIEN